MTSDTELANEPIHDILRKILREADEPLSMDEIKDRLYQRFQAGIRGLNHTGEWQKHDDEITRHRRRYSLKEKK